MPRGVSLYDEMRLQQRLEPEARRYIEATERAEGQATESAVRVAINAFVAGCKVDGTWGAIKACCILAGARTLTGALVPLVGAAPTNVNFVADDYDRRTGLVGNGTSKYLNSNRAGNADPQNNHHMAIFGTIQFSWNMAARAAGNSIGAKAIIKQVGTTTLFASNNSADTENSGPSLALGSTTFMGLSRSASGSYTGRAGGSNSTITQASGTPVSQNIFVFCANNGGSPAFFTTSRLGFYSIGEALDLARFDVRVSELMRRIQTAIH
jgi:hypothetical protein